MKDPESDRQDWKKTPDCDFLKTEEVFLFYYEGCSHRCQCICLSGVSSCGGVSRWRYNRQTRAGCERLKVTDCQLEGLIDQTDYLNNWLTD